MDAVRVLKDLGGVASKWQLNEHGVSDWEIGRARHEGRIIRVRRAWYALPSAERAVCAAVRVGGMLTCVSLLDASGVWTPPEPALHVSVAANASRLRSAESRFTPFRETPGVVLHWRPRAGATRLPRDTVAGSLVEAVGCLDEADVIAMTDSALRLGIVRRGDLRRAGMPARVVARADPSAESGGETYVRLRLRSMRCDFRTQAVIPGVGRVDFLVGDRLVIEVDGYAVHGDRDAFERDRARDLALVARGYLVIRVSYRQILEDWPRVERAIASILRSRRHRLPRRAA